MQLIEGEVSIHRRGRDITYIDVLEQPEKISAIVSKIGNRQAVICSWIKATSLISVKRFGP